jgi:hypothetical protein
MAKRVIKRVPLAVVGGGAKIQRVKVTPRAAAGWFLRDMAEASGYLPATSSRGTRMLSPYATYRPMLTAPDPWYFAGIIALEGCKVPDYSPPDKSGEVMREIFDQADRAVGRDGTDVATLAFLTMGRLGIGTVLLRFKAPDSLLGKIMMILMGSAKSAAAHMPAPEAHRQLRAALKTGSPVWWKMFHRRFELDLDAAPADVMQAAE